MAFQVEVKSKSDFQKEILETKNVLQVLEIYSDWCGPSKAINATLKRLYFEHGDRGLKFYTIQAGTLDITKPYERKCEPVFLFFRDGTELKDLQIQGINAPRLTHTVMDKLAQVTAAA